MGEYIDVIFSSQYFYIPFMLGIGGLIFSAINHSSTKKAHYSKERLEHVVAPIFFIVERSMHSSKPQIASQSIKSILDILRKHRLIAGGIMFEYYQQLIHLPTDEKQQRKIVKKFILYVDKEYDRLCNQLGIPTRRLAYKIKHYSFRFSSFTLLLFIQLFVRSLIIVAAAAFALLMLAATILYASESKNPVPAVISSIGIAVTYVCLSRVMKERE